MVYVLFSFVVLAFSAAIVFVMLPLARRRRAAPRLGDDRAELDDLLSRKAEVYASIKDLDFEYAMGRLADGDYQELRREYKLEAGELLGRQDDLEVSVIEQEIEEEVARRLNGSLSKQHRCKACGAANPPRFRFCPECGASLP